MKPIENTLESAAVQFPPAILEKKWLSYAEMSDWLSVSERTIRRDVDEGNLPKPTKIRSCVRFDRVKVEAALEAREQN
jgi:excisionase family DNA binding protein